MGWSEKYKKSIDCNSPKGFSQKAHCDGRKKRKNETMVFEEITEDILNEKLITYGSRKPYGQIVFMAGGAGSGKGFAIKNFVDSASFKIRDVDEMKKQLQILNRLGKLDIKTIIKKYGRNIKPKDLDLINKIESDGYRLQNLNLKNPDHVYALHILVKAMGIKDNSLANLLKGKDNPQVLPNILFDITAKDVTDITKVLPLLKKAGYNADNIHLTWVLTSYVTAMVNNKNRARMVPEDILLKTHEGAANTVWGLVTKALPKGMNGRVDVILNNPQHTVFYTDADGKTISGGVKGFLSLPLKKEKGGIFPEKVWKDKLFNWVKDNAPESITANMKESVNEAKGNPKFKVGNKVNYIPKLSGLNPKKKLEIIRVRYEDGDRFTKPGWYYSFKGMNLSSAEKDIKLAESVNEALTVDPKKVYGGTGAKEGMVLISQKGLRKILDLSKKNPSNVFLVSDDNYTNFGPYYVKNGKVAKYTVSNANYDLEKNKVRTPKVPSDVILKFKIMEGVSVNEDTKKRFDVDFYKGDGDRQTSHEEIIRGDKFSDVVSQATKVAKSKRMNYVEFYHKDAFIGSIDKRNGYEFKKGRGYQKSPLSVNEAMKPSQVRSAISKVKKGLMRKWKQKGGYENFGQKELSQMKDKFDYNPYGSSDERQIAKMLDGFDNWAMNYDGNMREAYIVTYAKKKGEKPASAAFQLRGSALSFEKDLKKDGYITMITQKKVKGIDEARRSVVHKAAKKGSFPVSLVVVKNGKVIDQELVKTPEAVPAAFNVIQSKHKGAIVHIEDKTGKRLFSESMVKPRRGHTYYQLTKDFPIKYIKGREGMGLEVPGVLIKNIDGYIDGKKGAYLIDYFGAMFYVDMKKKFASPVYSLKDQDKFKRGSITQVDMAPEHSDWKRYIKENIEERINLFVEENVPTNPSKWAYYKAQAKKKFDVYPSAYANGWAAKKYKAAGGGWRKEK